MNLANLIKDLEKEAGVETHNKDFSIKSLFSYSWKWNILDHIIYHREKKIQQFDKKVDLWQFPESEKAVDILIKNKNKKIALISDYDVDGITGNLVLTSYLRKLWYQVFSIIPERENWYGIKNNLVDKAKENWCEIIITIDNGTGAREPIEYAKSLGFIVIVTDHHLADQNTISHPDVLINYNMFTDLYPVSGCGAAFTLGSLLAEKLWKKDPEFEKELLCFVAISIIADVCPLYGINRKIVEKYLPIARNSKNLALRKLAEKVWGQKYFPEVWFGIAPVINSMGRYNRANEMFNYFFLVNEKKIDEELKKIVDFNEFRKNELNKLLEKTKEQVVEEDLFNLILFEPDEAEYGLLGLVAGRIASVTNKVTLVAKNDGTGQYWGSGRTGKTPIIESIKELKMPEVFVAGHNAACWFWINQKDIEKFKKSYADYLKENEQTWYLEVDTILPSPWLFTQEEVKRAEKIVWGKDYEEPRFATKNMKLTQIDTMKWWHLRLYLLDNKWTEFACLFFSWSNFMKNIKEWDQVDILYTISLNRWKWKEEIQYLIYNIKKSF